MWWLWVAGGQHSSGRYHAAHDLSASKRPVDNFTRAPELVRACRLILRGECGPQWNRIPDCPVTIESGWGVTAMEAYQWFLLGVMVAMTPSLLALALLLWRSNINDMGQNSADNSIL
jgi:hypothetical protein